MQLTAGKSNDSIVQCLRWQVVKSQRKFQYPACHVYQHRTKLALFFFSLLSTWVQDYYLTYFNRGYNIKH